MARDYKNAGKKPAQKPPRFGNTLSFVSGLSLGLLVAFAVYLWGHQLPRPSFDISNESPLPAEPAFTDSEVTLSGDDLADKPKREFDFYKILPEIEVKVAEWELPNGNEPDERALDQGTYVLQVGSFKSYADADRAKAQLALTGIQAKIHRVVINGQDVWYRVHVGPYSKIQDIQTMRARLAESGNDYILLRIGESGG